MNIYNIVREKIVDIVSRRYKTIDKKTLNFITCEQPKNLKFGDLSTNVLMILKKQNNNELNDAKTYIIKELKSISLFEEVSYINPGFINFIMKKNTWYKVLCEIIENNNYGFKNLGFNKNVNLEFISANPTGPLHVGHLRGAVLGDVLARLMIKTGYKVSKEYYINDLGNQIENLYKTVKVHIDNIINKTQNNISEDMYSGEYLLDIAKEIVNEKVNINDMKTVKEKIISMVLKLIKRDLYNLGITFDRFVSEKDIHNQGLLEEVLEILNKKNLVYEGVLEKPKGKVDKEWTIRLREDLIILLIYGEPIMLGM